jgi:hypothetical protein
MSHSGGSSARYPADHSRALAIANPSRFLRARSVTSHAAQIRDRLARVTNARDVPFGAAHAGNLVSVRGRALWRGEQEREPLRVPSIRVRCFATGATTGLSRPGYLLRPAILYNSFSMPSSASAIACKSSNIFRMSTLVISAMASAV